MKFFSVIVFVIFFICVVQAQRGGNRGRQTECPTICPLNYQPTCGFNGRCYKEFSNACALSAANCDGQGKFRQVGVQECNKRGARLC